MGLILRLLTFWLTPWRAILLAFLLWLFHVPIGHWSRDRLAEFGYALVEIGLVAGASWFGGALFVWAVGWRMRQFTRPTSESATNLVRLAGKVVYAIGMVAALGLIAATAVFACAVAVVFDWESMLLVLTQAAWMAAVGATGAGVMCAFAWDSIRDWEGLEQLPDVRRMAKLFARCRGFDPSKWFRKKGFFLGRGLDGRRVEIPETLVNGSHVCVHGCTGSGKTVVTASLTVQCMDRGQAVISIDPKRDENLLRLMAEKAKALGREFHYLDLDPRQGPQFSLLAGADKADIEEIFVTCFDLKARGTDADFHRSNDRSSATLAAEVVERTRVATPEDLASAKLAAEVAAQGRILTLRELHKACARSAKIGAGKYFMEQLEALARLEPVNSSRELDWAGMIERGAAVYVAGTASNEPVRALQKALALRVTQVIRRRENPGQARPVLLVFDEMRHVLGPALLDTLGVIRSANAHVILAGQSMADLDNCSGFAPGVVRGTVFDNTAIKIVLKLGEPEFANKLSMLGGHKRSFTETITRGGPGSPGSFREELVPLIPPDLLLQLPLPTERPGQACCGVLFGVGPAKPFYVGHIPVSGPMPRPTYADENRPTRDEGVI